MRFWQVFVSSGLILSSGLGLLVMFGNARNLMTRGLEADLVVQDFPLPPDMGVDPTSVAEFMAKELQRRLSEDVAIRLTLPGGTMDKVSDIVLPRLMNVVAVQAMLHEVPELSALLELGAIRKTLSGEVFTRVDAHGVAFTAPGALLATVDGSLAEITTTSTGMTALDLGDMLAGEGHQVVVWLGEASDGVDLARTIRLGAADGKRGRVLVRGLGEWFGADVEVLRWGRWLIGSLLGGMLVFGLASLLLPIVAMRKAMRR